ncbi:regulatory protein MarR [Lentilactobacillus otakiensis DSM 19908 = JCM 15040]|nr:regulatory protein MarR [Lentilactobacillus otakiensis DSM 19908 = JCM 15040]
MYSEEFKMKKKNSIELIKEQLEAFRSHDVDASILDAIKHNDQLDADVVTSLTISDLHIMRAAARDNGVKISAIVDQVALTQGAVSKIVNKLAAKGLVEKFHQSNNKKDTFVKLTTTGQIINQIHSDYHEREEAQLAKFADDYSKTDLETIATFMAQLNIIREKNEK